MLADYLLLLRRIGCANGSSDSRTQWEVKRFVFPSPTPLFLKRRKTLRNACMRYSIFGFNQQRVLSLTIITKNEKDEDVTLSIDTNDLLILNLIADFPNREDVKKMIIDDKVFFWASYDEILMELPVLGIKKQALANRFDKLEKMHLVERKYIAVDSKHQNATFFCLTKVYESLLYERGGYRSQIRDGIVVKYETHNNNNTNDNNKKEIEVPSIKKEWRENKDVYDELIDKAVGDILTDKEYKIQQEELYINIDFERTVIACANYWKMEPQWETYKRKKTKNPNFISTIKNGFHINKIYKQRYGARNMQYGYPRSIDDVKNTDVCKTYDFFVEWIDRNCRRVVDGIPKGFPQNSSQYDRLISGTKGGARGLAYACLVLNRDGWDKYKDENGFMWIYHKFIVANGMFIGDEGK